LTRIEKKKQVSEINDKLQKAKITIFSNFCGLKVEEMQNLRKQFREANIEYKVYKNTLIRRAFEGVQGLDDFLKEPTALTFSYDEISVPAKIMADFSKEKSALKIKGGLVEGQLMDKAAINTLAELPSREVLLTQLLVGLQSPIRSFVNVINGPLTKMVLVLKAIEEKKGTGK